MKIENFNNLINNGEIRTSKLAQNKSIKQLAIKNATLNCILDLLKNQMCIDNLEEFLHFQNLLKNHFDLKGNGTEEDPFTINSNKFKGRFFNSKQIFKNGYPKFVKPRNCHTNSYKFAKFFIGECQVIFGICHTSSSFIHSIVKIKDYILDFNYDLVMSEDLYYNLFNFEILNTIQNIDIQQNDKILIDYITSNKMLITDGEVNACFYELLEQIINKTI